MKELTLEEFLVSGTQRSVAEALGVLQSAVSQMVAAGRDIRVCVDENGRITSAYEVKPLGKASTKAQQAA
jgi:DNA-binding transcriptional regulator YdaS (Cro superfamily)